MRILIPLAAIATLAALVGCVNTSETQLAKGVWQIDAEGRGSLATPRIGSEVSKKAAALTLQQGYTHYILQSGSRSRGSDLYFNQNYATGQITATNIPVTNQGYIVYMFIESDPRAANAIDARTVQ